MGYISSFENTTIVPFVRRPAPQSGLGMRERIVAMRWADAARAHGVRAVRIHDPEPGDDPDQGSFLLIYCENALWARWGVSVSNGRFELWRPASGATVGQFATLDEALSVVAPIN